MVDDREKPLKLFVGEEASLVIESWKDVQGSIFEMQYARLLSNIDDTVPYVLPHNSKHAMDKSVWERSVERTPSNVFAIVGDRGAGKSSCMMSVMQMLHESGRVCNIEYVDGYKNIAKRSFHVLDTTDPSFFNIRTNVLELVVGRLFGRFRTEVSKETCMAEPHRGDELKNRLFVSFQKTLRCIDNASGCNGYSEDDIARLDGLLDGVELQCVMQRLIADYLDFFGNDFLVIPIDDMDLHTDCGYTMLEQIRKYLVQPRTIVVVSLRLDQMRRVIELENVVKYKPLLDMEMTTKGSVTEKASRYLAKLIPQGHRVFLQSGEAIMDREMRVYIRNGEGEEQVAEGKFPFGIMKYTVTSAIYRKTHYLFYHSKELNSLIVPTNLRDLRHLVGMLYGMEDYRGGAVGEANRDAFKQYFFNTWTTVNLGQHGNEFVQSLLGVKEASRFNKTVVALLNKKFSVFLPIREPIGKELEINYILSEDNAACNVSLGDIVVVVHYLRQRVTNRYDLALLFAISTMYTLRLHDSINSIMSDMVGIEAKEQTRKGEMVLYDVFDRVSQYDQLVGGCLINAKYYRLMAPSSGVPQYRRDACWRDIRSISISKINGYLNEKEDKADDEEERTKLLLRKELFALMLHRKNQNTRNPGVYDAGYRRRSEVMYLPPVGKEGTGSYGSFSNRQTVYFEVASLLVNITNIRRAYDRFEPRLWEEADAAPGSLLNCIRREMAKGGAVNGQPSVRGELLEERGDLCLFKYQADDKAQEIKRRYIKVNTEGKGDIYYETGAIDRRMALTVALHNFEVIEALTQHLTNSATSETSKVIDYVNNLARFDLNTYNNSLVPYRAVIEACGDALEKVPDFDEMLSVGAADMHPDTVKFTSKIINSLAPNGWPRQKSAGIIQKSFANGLLDSIDGMNDSIKREVLSAIEDDGHKWYTENGFRILLEKVLRKNTVG